MIITHNLHLIPPLSVERISPLCSSSRNRVSLTHKLCTCIIRCLLAIFLENECILRHWLFTRASQHYNNRHHPCQSFLLCVAPPLAHLWVQGPRWTPISRESNMLRPTDRHQTTTCQLYILLSMVEKENSVVCRPDHVGIPRYGCPSGPLHPKMSRGWSYTQKEGQSRMMAIGIVLRSTHGQPVPKDAPWMLVVQRCEA